MTIKSTTNIFVFFAAFFLSTTFFSPVYGQELKKRVVEEFLAAPTLYVITSDAMKAEFDNPEGESVSLEALIREEFSDKEIVSISASDYNDLKTKDKFHITLLSFNTVKQLNSWQSVTRGSLPVLWIRQGKHDQRGFKPVNYMFIDLSGIAENNSLMRLKSVVSNLKFTTDNYDEGDRDKYSYKASDAESIFSGNKLLIKRSDFEGSPAKMDKHYSNDYELVSDEEWNEAVENASNGIIYLEVVPGGQYSAVHIRRASDGKLLYAAYPWINRASKVGADLFKKVMK